MITMKPDTKTLERNLKRASAAFGDSTEQATFRWGIQIARELAGATQAFGKGNKTFGVQKRAIYFDAMNVVRLVKDRPQLTSASECYQWIEKHRTLTRRRTSKLPENQRKTVTLEILDQALAAKIARAGQAKGAWLGSGSDLMQKQKGTDQIKIGKSFLKHAQKFSSMGNAKTTKSLFSPETRLNNNVEYSSEKTVLADNRKTAAIKKGLTHVLKWYDKATTKKLKAL